MAGWCWEFRDGDHKLSMKQSYFWKESFYVDILPENVWEWVNGWVRMYVNHGCWNTKRWFCKKLHDTEFKSAREILCCVCILQKVWPDSDTMESLDDITSHKISPNIRQFFRYFENLSILSKQTVAIFGLLKWKLGQLFITTSGHTGFKVSVWQR